MRKIAMFVMVGLNSTEAEKERKLDWLQQYVKGVDDYLSFYTGEETDVRGFCLPYEGSNTYINGAVPPRFGSTNTARQFIRDGGTDSFTPDIIHAIGGYTPSWCGHGYRGLGISVRYSNYACGLKTDIHEILHADPKFALGHAGSVDEDGVEKEYAFTIMGDRNQRVIGLNAAHLYLMRLVNPHRVTVTEEFNLAPVEVPDICLHENEYRAALVGTADTQDFILSTRKVRGFKFALPQTEEGKLYIHRMDVKNKTKRLLPDLKEGESKTVDGFIIQHLGYENESVKVRVTK